MQEMINNIRDTKKTCYPTLMDAISDFIYREKRYNAHFSIALIYTSDSSVDFSQELRKSLRLTDKLISISDNLSCVVFDTTTEHSYVKAAENLCKPLRHANYHQEYYVSTAYSEDFDENYINMLNKVFERLEYSVSHKLCNTVIEQDYII